jgi:tetratricopeptide (TPR) repeat protein
MSKITKLPLDKSLDVMSYYVKGQIDEAMTLIVSALEKDPNNPNLLDSYASILQSKGDLLLALKIIVQAEKLAPENHHIVYNFGNIANQLGKYALAERAYQRSLCLSPDFAEGFNNLGSLMASRGHYHRAGPLFIRCLMLKPEYPSALTNLGIILKYQDKKDLALECFNKAIAIESGYGEGHQQKANLLMELENFKESITLWKQMIIIQPDWLDSYNSLAICFNELQLDEAIEKVPESQKILTRLLSVNPLMITAHTNLGNLYRESYDLTSAIMSHKTAIILMPSYAHAWSNLGSVRYQQGLFSEAISHYDHAQTINETLSQLNFNLALTYLSHSQWQEGWHYYEYRREKYRRIFLKSRWKGEDLEGKTILIHAEQGFGDVIQFSRFLPLLLQFETKVIFFIPQTLISLLKGLKIPQKGIKGSLEYLDDTYPIPDYDYFCPVMSLAYHFNIEPTFPKLGKAYLLPDQVKVKTWSKRLKHIAGLKIGLIWAGESRKYDRFAYALDQRRSLTLSQFIPFLSLEDITFMSLQKGEASLEIETIPPEIRPISLGDDLHDFSDSAALVSSLDLLITVDTSMLHVSGALGKPVWALSRFDGCWRWQRGSEKTIWYESVKLFWQKKPGDWNSPILEIKNLLQKMRDHQ